MNSVSVILYTLFTAAVDKHFYLFSEGYVKSREVTYFKSRSPFFFSSSPSTSIEMIKRDDHRSDDDLSIYNKMNYGT